MSTVRTEIIQWLHTRQYWVQIAAEKILRQVALTEPVVDELCALLKTKEGQKEGIAVDFSFFEANIEQTADIRLNAIGNIIGIDALAPKTPLEFSGGLPLIYGQNGSGKSSYTRILKKVCGKPNATDLKPNLFMPAPAEQKCTISVADHGKVEEFEWIANSAPLEKLLGVDIFDSDTGHIYLDGESDVCYVPDEVALFEALAALYKRLKDKLDTEKKALVGQLPSKPIQYQGTKCIQAVYGQLRPGILPEQLLKVFNFTDDDADSKKSLQERLQSNPADIAQKKRHQIVQINTLKTSLRNALIGVSPALCSVIFNQYQQAVEKRTIADQAAKAIADSSSLEGFGSATWKAMWEAARQYSAQQAYSSKEYPNTEDGASCVLCHQTLGAEAKERMQGFEEHVAGDLEMQASEAEKKLQDALAALPVVLREDQLSTQIQAAQLDETKWLPKLNQAWTSMGFVVDALRNSTGNLHKGVVLEKDFFVEVDAQLIELEKQVTQHELDAQGFDSAKINAELLELKGKEWACSHLESITNEVARLGKVAEIDEWLKLVRTNPITTKAGEVSKLVITDAYVVRFNEELKGLGAKKIKVNLVKTRVQQAKVKHQIILQGVDIVHAKHSSAKILSEGEQRIVALAAFLADVTGKPYKTPFIFDDPISSLDQIYEENMAKRLVALSEERQVIVFTHRLSFFGLITALGNPDSKHIRREAWGCGQHSEIPLFAKKPIKALSALKNERLHKARKALNEEGADAYYPLAKAICTDVRVLMERVVEVELLADVVQRHRRELHTLNKVDKLAKITPEDCSFIEQVMGDFSAYEHSQSDEAPVELPEPDELDAAISSVIEWHKEFKVRKAEEPVI